MTARYNRTLSEDVKRALVKDSAWHFLIADIEGLSVDRFALDIQIREDNEIMYYHGTTRLLSVKFSNNAKTKVWFATASADEAYGGYPECSKEYSSLMKKPWPLKDAIVFKNAWQAYLEAALKGVKPQYYSNKQEGYWQNRLCIQFGPFWTPNDEWLVIDRECVIGFDNTPEKEKHYAEAKQSFSAIKCKLQHDNPAQWGQPDDKSFGDEVDMLAINKSGELVVIELKHGKNTSGIYWGPLQVGTYYQAFKTALLAIKEEIRAVALQKIDLGLLPSSARERVKTATLDLATPVLAIADPKPKSRCWTKMPKVNELVKPCGNMVLKIAFCQSTNDALVPRFCDAEERQIRSLLDTMKRP